MKEIIALDGFFIKLIYKANNYMVSRFEPVDKETITVKGPSFDFEPYTKYTISGYFENSFKYGNQFILISLSKYIPSKKEEIIKFLASSSFKGIGKKTAEKIYAYYGDDTLKILKKDLSTLEKTGLNHKQIDALRKGLDMFASEEDDIVFGLISAGFSSLEANRIKNRYKENTALVLKNNPYQIYYDIYGLSFSKIANCFKNVEVIDKELKFKEAYLIYLFKELSFKRGDLYLYSDEFLNVYSRYYDDGIKILERCLLNELLIKEEDRYYLKSDYEDEKYIADYLKYFKGDLYLEDVSKNSH